MRLPDLKYDSPVRFRFVQRVQLAVYPPLIAFVLKNLLRTCRIEIRNTETFNALIQPDQHVILGAWHEAMAVLLQTHQNKNFHSVTSYSFDGELAARVVNQYGNEAVRGSTSRGGVNAIRQLEKALNQVPCVGITLDGPRGPRRIAQPGAAILASRTGVPILPHASAIRHCYRLKSWDRFPIPRPGTRILCAYGEPIYPTEDTSREGVEALRQQLQDQLTELHTSLENELGAVID